MFGHGKAHFVPLPNTAHTHPVKAARRRERTSLTPF